MIGLSRKIKETVFGLLYVMTDATGSKPKAALQNTIILYVLDWGQVFRVMMTRGYGWSADTYQVTKHVDMVYNATSLVTLVVPRYTLFALAFLLVSVSLGNAFYCGRLFRAGDIQKIGPVKLLRFLVALVVTTLFSSIMKWILIPVDCLVSDEKSFSDYVNGGDGTGDLCTPWDFPEIAIAIPTLVLTSVYCIFAMFMTFLSLGTNPLSSAPRFAYTGRVELRFSFMKIAVTFLPFMSQYITTVGASVLVFVLTANVMREHLRFLPFHSEATNHLRGGIYGSLLWLSACSVFVAAAYEGALWSDQIIQTTQWILVGCTPIAIMLGNWVVVQTMKDIQRSLDRLRGEWESHESDMGSHSQTQSITTPRNKKKPVQIGRTYSEEGGETILQTNSTKRSNYEEFFDPSWERKRAFNSGISAHTSARVLLCQRVEADLPFLAYVVSRGLEEFPEYDDLHIFRLSLLRFVYKNTKEAASEEKKLRNESKALAFDLQYVLYAVERKASQDIAASTMGQGQGFNAINLLEYDAGMGQARTAHLECITAMKRFWHVVCSRRARRDIEGSVNSAIDRLGEFNKAQIKAQQEYLQLLDKYPQSIQLIHAYANFCDKVLNNPKEAEFRRKQAIALRHDHHEEEEDEILKARLDNDDAKSAATSDHESTRTKQLANFKQWSSNIFGSEMHGLIKTDSWIKLVLLLLISATVTTFAFSQYWLFKNVALRDAHLINRTGLLRAWTISSTYLFRTLQLAGLANNEEKIASVSKTITTLSGNFQEQHKSNYEIISTELVDTFYTKRKFVANYPLGTEWISKESSFWFLGNDLARRIERGQQASVAELQSSDYRIEYLSEPKQNIAFVMENAFRALLPVLEEIVVIYEEDMKGLADLTATIVASCSAGIVAMAVILAALVMRAVIGLISKMTHMYLACILALSLPSVTTKKIYQFYHDAENEMKAEDDEELEKKLLTTDAPDHYDQDDEDEMDPSEKIQALDNAAKMWEIESSNSSPDKDLPDAKILSTTNLTSSSTVLVLERGGNNKPMDHKSSDRNQSPKSLGRDSMKPLATMNSGLDSLKSAAVAASDDENDLDRTTHSHQSANSFRGRKGRSGSGAVMNGQSVSGIGLPLTEANLKKHTKTLSRSPSPQVIRKRQEHPTQKPTSAIDPRSSSPSRAVQKSYESDLAENIVNRLENGVPAKSLMRSPPDLDTKSKSASVSSESLSDGNGSKGAKMPPGALPILTSSLEFDHGQQPSQDPWEMELADSEQLAGIQEQQHGQMEDDDQPLPAKLEQLPAEASGAMPEDLLPESQIEPEENEGSPLESADVELQIKPKRGSILKLSMSPNPVSVVENLEEEDSRVVEFQDQTNENRHVPPLAVHDDDEKDKVEDASHFADRKASWKGTRFSESSKGSFSMTRSSSFQKMADQVETATGLSLTRPFSSSMRKANSPGHSDSCRNPGSRNRGMEENLEEDDVMPLNDVDDEAKKITRRALEKYQPLINKWWLHLGVVVSMIGVSIMFTMYPARRMDALVDLAPTINQAGRRRFLTRACVHLSRELVLNDGFSRMSRNDVASALSFYLLELGRADDAVRLGGAYNIGTGADYRENVQHNEIMYGEGCPWRKDPTDCSTPEKPGAADNGLHHLSLTFMDSVRKVLAKYGPPVSEYTENYLDNPRDLVTLREFDNITVDPERVKILSSDPDLVFIQNSFAGDLFTGYARIVTIFDQELLAIVEQAVHDNEILFAISVVLVTIVFYIAIFRRSMAIARSEASAAKAFVSRMPAYTLSTPEINTVRTFFDISH